MTDVVITEFMEAGAVERLSAAARVHYDPDLPDKPQLLAELAAGARALVVRNRTQVRGALLEGATSLSCVGRLGVGLDNIDMDEFMIGFFYCSIQNCNEIHIMTLQFLTGCGY